MSAAIVAGAVAPVRHARAVCFSRGMRSFIANAAHFGSLMLVASLVACRGQNDAAVGPTPVPREAHSPTAADAAASAKCPAIAGEVRQGAPPPYLARMAELNLFVRTSDGGIANATARDDAVVRSYPKSTARGPLIGGMRMTLLTEKTRVARGEEVRVIHVLEIEAAGKDLFVMGPKPVAGEHLDGNLVTPRVPIVGAFTTEVYDGMVVRSPGVDTNYDVTRYTFANAGVHTLEWRDGVQRSNTLCIEVE